MDVKLPALGEGADSGTVVNLFVKEGDEVTKDQPLLELENEKAVASIPSTAAGKITKVFVKTGEKISVGQRLVSVSESGDGRAAQAAKVQPEAESQPAEPEAKAQQKEKPKAEEQAPAESEPQPTSTAPPAASPSIRKLARDLGIDLSRVRGSESGGRIVLPDLRAYIQRLQSQGGVAAAKPAAPAAAEKPKTESIDFSRWGPVSKKALSPLRQVIARRMAENWNAVPHVTQFDEADITGLMDLRKKYADAYEQKGARLTLTSFALKIGAELLKKYPALNSSLDEAAQEIITKEYYHIGVAVDTEAGLIVPVLRDADKKSMFELSKELEDLAKKARERKLSAEELKGGTFTISNQGGIGSAHFTPIVNKPEVAILGLGRGAMKPIVREGKIEARLMLPLALSYDHRVIDGGTAARFMVDLVRGFEGFGEGDVKL